MPAIPATGIPRRLDIVTGRQIGGLHAGDDKLTDDHEIGKNI
jgi:hypothetical protein